MMQHYAEQYIQTLKVPYDTKEMLRLFTTYQYYAAKIQQMVDGGMQEEKAHESLIDEYAEELK